MPLRVQISENENTTDTFKQVLTKFYEKYRTSDNKSDFFS